MAKPDPSSTVAWFIRQGWARLQMENDALLTEAEALFMELLDNPPRAPFNFDYDRPNDPDSGLVYREGQDRKKEEGGGKHDHKIFFHYRPQLEDCLRVHNPQFLQDHARFFKVCAEIRSLCQEKMIDFLKQIDRRTRAKQQFHPWIGGPKDVLRFLAYTKLREGSENESGEGHYDRDAFSFALRESHPGLEFWESDNTWVPVSSRPNEPLIFTGGITEQLAPDFRAKWHRVRNVDPTSRVNARVIRLSTVFFGHLSGHLPFEVKTHVRRTA